MYGCVQAWAYDVLNHEWWPPFMVTLLLFNMILLATSSYNQPQAWTDVVNAFDATCIIIYFIEFCLRLMAAGRFRCCTHSIWHACMCLLSADWYLYPMHMPTEMLLYWHLIAANLTLL